MFMTTCVLPLCVLLPDATTNERETKTMKRIVSAQIQSRFLQTHLWRQTFSTKSNITEHQHSSKKRLDVAIVGAPNAGKSQLLNTITNATISAVSRKRHTTRNGILATKTFENTQLVFIDTPGFVTCRTKRDEGMLADLVRGAHAGMDRADYTLVVIDAAKRIDDQLREELAVLMVAAQNSRGRVEEVRLDEDGNLEEVVGQDEKNAREKFAIVLNKVDLVNPKTLLLDLAEELGVLGDTCVRYRGEVLEEGKEFDLVEKHQFTEQEEDELLSQYPPVFFISALKNDGVDDLLQHLFSRATDSKDFILPPKQQTTMSEAERVEEMIREKLYRCLHKEVPHSITQVNRFLKRGRTSDGKIVLRIDQDLIVRTKSHHKLVMGRGGMTLERIRQATIRDLLKMFKSDGIDDIILNLHVKLSHSKHNDRPLEADRQGVMNKSF